MAYSAFAEAEHSGSSAPEILPGETIQTGPPITRRFFESFDVTPEGDTYESAVVARQ